MEEDDAGLVGVAEAQYNLGVMCYEGRGVPRDFPEAVRWFRLAADQGHAWAQTNLGFMSEMGGRLGGRLGDCPVTERTSDCLVRLPFFAGLGTEPQETVIEAILIFG